MSRDLDSLPPPEGRPAAAADLVLRSSPNWTVCGFIAMLGAMHLTIAIPTLLKGRWEAYLSLILGTLFVAVALVCLRLHAEVAFLGSRRRVRLRRGLKCLYAERTIPFAAVHGVRLTLPANAARRPVEARIELLCPYEDIECPPTRIPRQQALLLAMLMNVPLIKVSDEPVPPNWGSSPRESPAEAEDFSAPPAEGDVTARRRLE